ncbi:alcohol dehydrogenase [bacterium BMS3Bbin14]|nr:alcohol dehydrogenase [bacterium BMS3Abin13]GBE51655.1 alcohol dehydrogenase [bacterium BMS3Bbin14]HDK43358.1 zinc-binding alcohol dehydrogenase family protein [Desulfobacteraceae bacterium]HDL98456.1 zinc-binding alcohol dehydrogenase family protein [Desulfobacteraceae bacterium]
MKAQVLQRFADMREQPEPLTLCRLPVPVPGEHEILIRVSACGVCHTELDEIEGRLSPRLPVVPGHQVVGRVEKGGRSAKRFQPGDRVGVGWIYSACGHCEFCKNGLENLCPEFQATGRDADGGYAEYMTVAEDFAYQVPDIFTDIQAAPLFCAGGTGFRSLRLTGLVNGQNLGLTGFGGSGHLVLQMARYLFPDSNVFVFARNPAERSFALELGAVWAGDPAETAPEPLHAIIDTTPAWRPVVAAMANLAPGGRLVINAIRKEGRDQEVLLELDYQHHLWLEKEIKSVANVCRRDVADFLELAAKMDLKPEVEVYPLERANQALYELKTGKIRGAKVLRIS